jgi:Holliday junction DNA helicase RuvA
MFHHVTGTLASKSPTEAVLEAGGVGYLIRIPLSTYEALPPAGKPATLLTYLHVTDDALTLFGFGTAAEREFFLQLIQNVNGVGPKLALAVLSGGRLDHLQQAIRLGDVAFLKSIRGVGDATAKRIVLELGKILVKQVEAGGEAGREDGKGRRRALATVQAPTITQMDEMTELAVKAVAQLNEVPRDVALKAVQWAFDEMRAEGAPPEAVQDLVQRALRYAE